MAVLLPSACAGGSASAPAVSPPPAASSAAAAAGPSCGTDDPLVHVYRPERLQVLARCKEARGRVLAVVFEDDGDYHIWLALDPGYEGLLSPANLYEGKAALVLEIIPDCPGQPPTSRDAAHCPASRLKPPAASHHIAAWGAWVSDLGHDGWHEIHPLEGWRFL